MEILRDDRCRCSSGLTLQLQRAVDYDRAVCHVISSINERRNYNWKKNKNSVKYSSIM